jgi:hypothetical protein
MVIIFIRRRDRQAQLTSILGQHLGAERAADAQNTELNMNQKARN